MVVLTLDEECNLPLSLGSVCGWAREIVVVDSGSSDRTREVAKAHGARVVVNRFESYSQQRNFAIRDAGIDSPWILFLDADEQVSLELRVEIDELLKSNPPEVGFYIPRRLIWLGSWVRRGYYPTYILRLFRRDRARCEDRAVNEHMIVDGRTGQLQHDLIHDDQKGVMDWARKHLKYARLEANELLSRDAGARQEEDQIPGRLFGSQAERVRWLRQKVWERLPPLVRPFPYFAYRYFVRGGILDGRSAFTFHFLQGLWFHVLVDTLYLEAKLRGLDYID